MQNNHDNTSKREPMRPRYAESVYTATGDYVHRYDSRRTKTDRTRSRAARLWARSIRPARKGAR